MLRTMLSRVRGPIGVVGATALLVVGLAPAAGAVANDPPLVEITSAANSVSESSATETIAVRRFGDTSVAVTVDYTTVDGTATAGDDYTATSGTLTFVGGDTSESIIVPILEDALVEGREAFSIVLSNPTAGAALSDQATGIVLINDNDDIPGFVEILSAANSVLESAVSETVTVRRFGGSGGTVTVDYTTVDGTATAGADYTATSGTLTFADGDSSESITVPILEDVTVEGHEAFSIVLSNPTGGGQLSDQATGKVTISDNDDSPGFLELQLDEYSVSEATFSRTLVVERFGGTGGTVTVDYTTVDGTATAGSDYTATSGTLTFAHGDGSESITVPILEDAVTEGDEAFSVLLSSPTGGAALSDQTSAIVRITDNDAVVGDFSVSNASEPEDGVTEEVRITRSGDGVGAVSVDYTVVDLTATRGTDFTMAASGTVAWGDGETGSKDVLFTPTDDALVEGNEFFQVVLSNPTGGATLDDTRIARVEIVDDERPVGYITVGSASEPEDGVIEDFVLSRREGSQGAVSVDYTVVDLTATRGTDFTMVASGTVSWADGDAAGKSVTFTPIDDALVEGIEYFHVVLSNPTGGATLTHDRIGSATMRDDDLPVGYVQVNTSSVTEPEDGAIEDFGVTRLEGSGGAVSVDYTVVDLTATRGADFTMVASGTVSWADGEGGVKPVTFTPIDDSLVEGTEYFQLVLSNPTGGAPLADGRIARGNLTDDELGKPGEVSLSSATASADEDDGPMVFTVQRLAGSSGAASVDYTVTPGSATAGADYTAVSGTFTWIDEDFSDREVNLPVIDDFLSEGPEDLTVTLTNFVGAAAGSITSATGTIIDDEPLPVARPGLTVVAEGDAGTVVAAVPITLSFPSDNPVTVDWTTFDTPADGIATEDVDFAAASGTVTFDPGETSASADITVFGDLVDEDPAVFGEWALVSFSNPSPSATLDLGFFGIGIASIVDDDPPPTIRPGAAAVLEGDTGEQTVVEVPVTLSNPSDREITIDWTTTDSPAPGIATEGVDFLADSGTVTFGPGDTEETVAITVLGDTLDEPPAYLGEWGLVLFSNPSSNATLDLSFFGLGIFVIVDDDP